MSDTLERLVVPTASQAGSSFSNLLVAGRLMRRKRKAMLRLRKLVGFALFLLAGCSFALLTCFLIYYPISKETIWRECFETVVFYLAMFTFGALLSSSLWISGVSAPELTVLPRTRRNGTNRVVWGQISARYVELPVGQYCVIDHHLILKDW